MKDNRRRALGKGLEELFSSEILSFNELEENIVKEATSADIVELDIDELRPNPYQPRKVFDEDKLNELAVSIKQHGVFQPIIVKKSAIRGYEIIAGERRVKASKIAGLKTVPAIVKEFDDNTMMEISLLENLQRENLNPIEEALAYQNLLNHLNVTQEVLAERLGKSRSHITNMLGILKLPQEVRTMISEGKIPYSKARVISKLENQQEMIKMANVIINEGLNTRDVELKLKEIKHPKIKNMTDEYRSLEDAISEKLGTKVKITKNKLEISFSSTSDLNRILEITNLGN